MTETAEYIEDDYIEYDPPTEEEQRRIDAADKAQKYTSPLTKHNRPRKRAYSKSKKYSEPRWVRGKEYKTDNKARKKIQHKLDLENFLIYAPRYAYLYTMTYKNAPNQANLAVDIFVILDNRLYKISAMVGKILGYVVKEMRLVGIPGVLHIKNVNKEDLQYNHVIEEMEARLIEDLSMKMFNCKDGYIHMRLATLANPFEVKRVQGAKDYRVRKPE